MRENLDVIKRLLALGLTVFMAGSTLVGDFTVIADQENHCEEFSDDYAYTEDGTLVPGENSDGYCDDCGRGEEYHEHIEVPQEEPAAEEVAPDTAEGVATDIGTGDGLVPVSDEQIQGQPEQADITTENTESTNSEAGNVAENQIDGQAPTEDNPESNPGETPETSDSIIDNSETETPSENIEETTEEKTQEELDKEAEEKRLAEEKEKEEKEKAEKEKKENCEHQWEYVSNGEGTHTMKCTECGEEATEECSYDEAGICIHCGFENPEEKECEHEWAYTSNNDGTHTKKCTKCGIEETEECQLNADGVCELCGYEDERLIHQTFTRTIHGVTVTVDGMMPRGSKVTIFTKPLDRATRIVNDNIELGNFTALEVFDIDIYRRGGDKYQPSDYGDAVSITFAGISQLTEVDEEEEIVVYRIEEDETVTEVENDVAGEDVSFEAEHFSQYVAGTITYSNTRPFKKYEKLGFLGIGQANYTLINGVDFPIELDSTEKEITNFTVYLFKDVNPNGDLKESGQLIDTQQVEANKSTYVKGEIHVDFNVDSDNAYITKGQYYAVVVETDNSCKVGYGASSTSTYIYSDSQVWGAAPNFNGIFKENKTGYDTITDSHNIVGIKALNGDASGTTYAETYIYGKQKSGSAAIDTLEAVFDSDIDRIITWESSNPGVVSIDSATGQIKALASGQATITATYTAAKKKTIVIKVMSFTMDAWDPDGTGTQPDYYYTGDNIQPETIAYIGTETQVVNRKFSNQKDVGTASVEITYTNDSRNYVFTRYYEIKPLTLNSNVFTSANVIRDGNGNIVEFTGLAPVGTVTPKYNSSTKDFNFTVNEVTPVADGIRYYLNITGTGNFTGTLTNQVITQKNVAISDVIGVRLSTNSRLASLSYTGKPVTLTETQSGTVSTGWEEVEFYNLETNETLEGVITTANCVPSILNSAGEVESTSAGTHRIVFAMNSTSGYTGSLYLTFEIRRPSLRNTTIKWKDNKKQFYHTGQAIEPRKGNSLEEADVDFIVVEADGTTVVDKDNYEATYSGLHTDIGTYTITVKGKNNYDPETNQQDTYEIIADFALDMRVRLYVDGNLLKDVAKNGDYYETGYSRVYDGTKTTPDVKIYVPGEGELDNSGDRYYSVTPSDSSDGGNFTENVGTKYLIITPTADLVAKYPTAKTQKATYKVTQCPINSSKVKVTRKSNIVKKYNTLPQTLTVAGNESDFTNADIMVRYGTSGEVLQNTSDYTIAYSNNTDVGTATYVIEAVKDENGQYTGNYSGKIAVTQNIFTIEKAQIKTTSNPTGTVIVDGLDPVVFKYDGTEHKPTKFNVKINGEDVPASNYEVSYSDNCISPTGSDEATMAYLQITGQNNIEGTIRLYFQITASNDPYTAITIDGQSVDVANPVKTLEDGTRVYTMSSDKLYVPYTGRAYDKTVVVYGIGAKVLNAPGERLSYDAEFENTINAKDFNIESDPEGSPRLVIKGLNNYAGNNAIVYFNVKPIDIGSEDITFVASEADDFVKNWNDDTPVSLENLVIKINGRTLVEGSSTENDYWVTYESEPRPKTAGDHKVVIHGRGNYSGVRDLPYKIGIDISSAYVGIYGPYLPADPINPNNPDGSVYVDKFLSLTMISNMVANYGETTPLKNTVKWRGNDKAPRVRIYASQNSTVPLKAYKEGDSNYDYELTMTPSFGNYCSRKVGEETSTNYNTVRVHINANTGTTKYYGEAEFYFQIYPQEINQGGGAASAAVGIASTDAASKPYTGKKQTIVPSIQFYNGGDTAIELNRTESGVAIKDFTPASYEIGPDLSTRDINTTLSGLGNFTGEITYRSKITKGNVNIFRYAPKGGVWATLCIGQTPGAAPAVNTSYQPYTVTYDLHSQTAGSWAVDPYTYNGKSQIPTINLTSIDPDHVGEATSETITLTPGKDYTETVIDIDKNTNDTVSVGKKRMTLSLINSNFYAGTIVIEYEIVRNTIQNFNSSLTPIKYKGEPYTIGQIKGAIDAGNMTLTVVDSTGAELIRNRDYEIVTDSNELTAINNQFSTNYADIIVSGEGNNFEPRDISDKPNYIFIKGKGTYSDYCKVPFNTYLDITSTNGENELAKVYFDNLDKPPTWLLSNEKTIGTKLKIRYKKNSGISTFDGELPLTSTVANESVDNYSLTRGKAGKPGPDDSITVVGDNLATGVAEGIKYNHNGTSEDKTVCFLADLSTYPDITFTNDVILDCNGTAYQPQPAGLQGIPGSSTSTTDAYGDYVITYKYKKHKNDTDTQGLSVAKEAGYYELYVEATANSEYYTSNTGSRFSFYVKYNLSAANTQILFYNDSGQTITEMSYTGQPYKINEKTVVKSEGGDVIYDFASNIKDLVTLSPESVTQVKYNPGYTITATAKDTGLVYGNKTATFSIKVVSLQSATFKLYDPWSPNTEKNSYTYIGGNIEPVVKGTITVGGVTKNLTEGVDFSVNYHNQKKVGTASITIIGLGAYECPEFEPENHTYTITELKLNEAAASGNIRVDVDEATYGGYYNDYTDHNLGTVKQEPDIEVYYVDTLKGIENKLQKETDRVAGDYKVTSASYSNNTKAELATATNAPQVIIEAGTNGNTSGSTNNTPKKFAINKLNLSSGGVEITQKSAQYTGYPINVFDVVKITSGSKYKIGDVEYPVYLAQKGADSYLDTNNLYDYEIIVTKGSETFSDGQITDIGTYNITIEGKNSCIGQIASETFTITERSLPDNFHYYYSSEAGDFVGTRTEMKDANNKFKGYEYTGGLKDSSGNVTDTLTIRVYDVETLGAEDNPDNIPKIEIIDKRAKETATGIVYEPHELDPAIEFTLSVANNRTAGTGDWARTVTSDKHAPVAAGSPTVTITGAGSYTGTLKLPYSIGKNIVNIADDLEIFFTVKDTKEGITSVRYLGNDNVQWHYTYNGAEQVPKVNTIKYGNVNLVNGTDFTLTFTDGVGNSDTSINAGYKYAVITGTGTYCGTLKTKYAVNKKEVTSAAQTFTNEKPMTTDDGKYVFAVTGGAVKRLTTEKAQELLTDIPTDKRAQYKDYYYAIYDGAAIKPDVIVNDNNLSKYAKTTVIDAERDLDIIAENANAVSTFDPATGTLGNCSYLAVSFKDNTGDPENFASGSNYYVPSGSSITYRISYLILRHNLADDFYIKFKEEGLSNTGKDWTGNTIEPEIDVYNGKRDPLIRSIDDGASGDYIVEYSNNILPGVATVKVTGVNNYKGTKTAEFTIWGHLEDTTIYFKDSDGQLVSTEYDPLPTQAYTGGPIVPDVVIKLDRKPGMDQAEDLVLNLGTADSTGNYQYYVSKNESPDGTFFSKGIVTFTGNSNQYWSGDKSLEYNIEYDEDRVTLSIDGKEFKYTGFAIKPTKDEIDVSITTAIKVNVRYFRDLDNDGEITYSEEITNDSDFIDLGEIKVMMTYKVGSSDEKTAEGTYTIVPRPLDDVAGDDCTVVMAKNQRYTGYAVTPPVSVSIISYDRNGNKQEKILTAYDESTGTGDYIIDYGNYVYSKTEDDAKVVLTANAPYITGNMTLPYTIKLQNIVNLRVTEKTGDSLTVEWVKDLYSTGTELELLTGGRTVAIVKAVGKKNTQVFKNLKGSTEYTVLARAYAVVGDDEVIFSHEDSSVTDTTDMATADMDVVSTSKGKATVAWGTEGTVKVYYIYRASNATDEGTLVAIIPATTGSFTNSKLTSGVTYYFHTVGYGLVDGDLAPVNKSEPKKVTVL